MIFVKWIASDIPPSPVTGLAREYNEKDIPGLRFQEVFPEGVFIVV